MKSAGPLQDQQIEKLSNFISFPLLKAVVFYTKQPVSLPKETQGTVCFVKFKLNICVFHIQDFQNYCKAMTKQMSNAKNLHLTNDKCQEKHLIFEMSVIITSLHIGGEECRHVSTCPFLASMMTLTCFVACSTSGRAIVKLLSANFRIR